MSQVRTIEMLMALTALMALLGLVGLVILDLELGVEPVGEGVVQMERTVKLVVMEHQLPLLML